MYVICIDGMLGVNTGVRMLCFDWLIVDYLHYVTILPCTIQDSSEGEAIRMYAGGYVFWCHLIGNLYLCTKLPKAYFSARK